MDSSALVSSGQSLVKALDAAGQPPRAALWVHSTDTDTWKLWIVPAAKITDKRDFYRRIAEIISKDPSMSGISASDTEMILENHPAIQGLRSFLKAPELSAIDFRGNRFKNYYLPDGILLRMNL